MLDVMQAAADNGIIVNVHAEDGPLASHLTKRLLAAGKTSLNWLPEARPPSTEALAIYTVSTYAEALGCPLYIVHLASRAALEVTSAARARGAKVFVETRPMYLYLDRSRYDLPGVEGNKFVCWPPLRSLDDQDALWDGLASGEIQAYGTDHVPWTAAQMMGPDLNFSQIPGGASNARPASACSTARGRQGRISLRRFVELIVQSGEALWHGPGKGLADHRRGRRCHATRRKRRFRSVTEEMQSRGDLDPYHGYESTGWPVLTMARGG
jgi:dihydropyrimidinase